MELIQVVALLFLSLSISADEQFTGSINSMASFATFSELHTDQEGLEPVIDFEKIVTERHTLLDEASASKELARLPANFKTCFLESGINKDSFQRCVGDNYELIPPVFNRKILEFKNEIVEMFKSDIESFCVNNLEVLCDSVMISLNYFMVMNRDPVANIETLLRDANASEEIRLNFKQPLLNLQHNYDTLRNLESEAKRLEKETADAIIGFIDDLNRPAGFSYSPNPFIITSTETTSSVTGVKRRKRIFVRAKPIENESVVDPLSVTPPKTKNVVIKNEFALSLLKMKDMKDPLMVKTVMGLKGKKKLIDLHDEILRKSLNDLNSNENSTIAKKIML